jgi:nicotinamide/nicotinate riboside kinase
LLRAVIPGAFILHQDDFYKVNLLFLLSWCETDEDIPIDPETGYANWDCADALNMEDFVNAMRYIRTHEGKYPPSHKSIQGKTELGDPGISKDVIEDVRQNFLNQHLLQHDNPSVLVCLVDGFFLYSDPAVVDELDLRFLIRAPYQKLKARREARGGYVTLEGQNLSHFK